MTMQGPVLTLAVGPMAHMPGRKGVIGEGESFLFLCWWDPHASQIGIIERERVFLFIGFSCYLFACVFATIFVLVCEILL